MSFPYQKDWLLHDVIILVIRIDSIVVDLVDCDTWVPSPVIAVDRNHIAVEFRCKLPASNRES